MPKLRFCQLVRTPPKTQPATRNFFRFSFGVRVRVCVPYIYKLKLKKIIYYIELRCTRPRRVGENNTSKKGNATGLRVAFYGFTFHCPPLAGPMRSMSPSALWLARCFSTDLAEMPIFPARAIALNLPSSESKATIFSLLFWGFLPTFWAKIMVFSLLFLWAIDRGVKTQLATCNFR